MLRCCIQRSSEGAKAMHSRSLPAQPNRQSANPPIVDPRASKDVVRLFDSQGEGVSYLTAKVVVMVWWVIGSSNSSSLAGGMMHKQLQRGNVGLLHR